MEEGDHEDQGGAEQHGEIPEGTTGEGDQGAASSLAAARAESWTGQCCEATAPNLSQGRCSQCCFLLLHIISLGVVLLPSPCWGSSQPFLLSCSAPRLTILLPGVYGGFGCHLQAPTCRSGWFLPLSAALPPCLSCSTRVCPDLEGVFGVAGENQATAAVLLRIMQRK